MLLSAIGRGRVPPTGRMYWCTSIGLAAMFASLHHSFGAWSKTVLTRYDNDQTEGCPCCCHLQNGSIIIGHDTGGLGKMPG